MAQHVKALAVLTEDPGSASSPHGGSQPCLTPVLGLSDALF